MDKLETLRKELERAKEELHNKGFHYDGHVNSYEDLRNVKPFEIAYQDVIEKIWPDDAWWQVTNYWDIFDAMMSGINDEEIIDEIIKHVGKDYINESKCDSVGNSCVERGHTMREYLDKFGEDYEDGNLWDFSKKDFEEGAVEQRDDIVYWYMKDLDGEWRYFETNIKNESLKEEKKLDEGTSNFGAGPEDFPLLVFYTIDEVFNMMDYADDRPKESDFEDEDGNVDEDAYESAREDWEQKFWDNLSVCVLDEDEQERLEDMLYDFNEESKRMAWDADVVDGEQQYENNLSLEDVKVEVRPGYYEAAYISIEHEDYLKDLDDDFREEQYARFEGLFKKLEEEFGLTELSAGPVASNGERGYSIVKKENKEECLKESDDVAREEYCVIVDGNNESCHDTEEEAIKYARKRFAEKGNDSVVKVLLVKYGPKDENGDEPEEGVETIWASHFEESLEESKKKSAEDFEKEYVGKRAIFTHLDEYDEEQPGLKDREGEPCDIKSAEILDAYDDGGFDYCYWNIEFDDGEKFKGIPGVALDVREDEALEESKEDNDKKRLKYLLDKEDCCTLDKGERFELQDLIQKYGRPEEEIDLPKDVVMDTQTMDDLGINPSETEGDEIDEIISDWLSDEYGFCHFGFEYDVEGDHINIYNIEWDTSESLKEENIEEKKSKKKYKVNFTGDPAKNAAFFNHAMGSDKGEGGANIEAGGTTLGEEKILDLDDLDDSLLKEEDEFSDKEVDIKVPDLKASGDKLSFDEIKALVNELYDRLAEQDVYYDVWFDESDSTVTVGIDWGDWKHDHMWLDIFANKFFEEKGYDVDNIGVEVTDEDGSDTYSANHTFVLCKKRPVEEGASYRGLAYYEYPKGSDCHVRETPSCFVATDRRGTTIGDSKTKAGAEGLIDDYLKDKKVKEDLDDGEAFYYVKYWEDEELRDQGISEIYMDDFKTKEEAVRLAKKLIDFMGYASVEVFYTPSGDVNESDDELVFGYDGVETWGSDKKEESLEEDNAIYCLHLIVKDSNGKILKDEDIECGSKKEMDEKKKHLEEVSPEDSHHNRNFYSVRKR